MTGLRPEHLASAGHASMAIGGAEDAWGLCLEIVARRRSGVCAVPGDHIPATGISGEAGASCDRQMRWHLHGEWTDDAVRLFDLHAPMLALQPGERHVCAHLGQSIDGRIATANGHSAGLSDAQNLLHLHRLRALSDAIVVGSATVLADDPRLTTRLVPGRNPVRVVLDGRGRIQAGLRLCSDAAAPTLVVGRAGLEGRVGLAKRLPVAGASTRIPPSAVIDALAAQGLHVIFIEGGGTTVSRFLEHDALDRLQLTISPLLLGSGRPALSLPPIQHIGEARRPPARRFRMGEDLMWDFALRDEAGALPRA